MAGSRIESTKRYKVTAVSTEEDGVDEPVRSTQPSLIMAPPGLEADPDEEAADAVVDNDIMSSSRTRAGSSRSAASKRDSNADGADGDVTSGDAVTSAKDAPAAASAKDAPAATSATVAPLPADTIGKAKAADFDTLARPAETAAVATPAAKSNPKPSFTPSVSKPAPTTVTPSVPGAPAAPTAAPPSAKPAGVRSPASAPAPPAGGHAASNGSSPSAAAAAAVTGAAAGLASSVASAWQRRGSNRSSRPDRPRGAQLRRPARRQAMLTLARVEPWSVMKFSFVASVVAFIILFVAVAVLYLVLAALGVFDSLQHTVSSITGAQGTRGTDISHYYSASVVLGYTAMLGALNIVLITAMSTVGSVIYNLIAKTIGGIEVTLRETE